MEKLIDIKGYWSLLENHSFKDTDILDGSIIINSDGWFEGLTTDLNSRSISFVFGVMTRYQEIKLFKFNEDKISPQFELEGECIVTGFDGVFEIIGVIQPLSSGVCHIDCKYPELSKEEIEKRIKELEKSINRYKNNNMDDLCRNIYNNYIKAYYKLDGVPTYDDSIDLIEEYYTVNNGNINATMGEVMRLHRGKPINTDGALEDLPF